MTNTSDRRERYATAIHDAMETDLSLADQEPAYQALIARAAEAAEALADAEQNRQFLTTLANLGIATHRLDRIRDAARLHRQQLLGTSELYAVIEADDEPEQCPRSEFDGYGLQCQKPAGHNLCTFEEQPAAVSAAVAPPTTHGLSIPHSKALYDAIATPGPDRESFDDQHANVCRAVREILDDLLPAPTETTPSHRAGLRDEIVKALGRIETVPPVAHRREQADHVLAVLYREWPWLRAEAEDAEPTDRAAVLDLDAIAARAADAQQYGIEDDGFEQLVREDVPALITALRRMADETATETPAVDLPTLAAALDGLHTLIATSSRDWQTYRVDAWLWAVLCGWDCEQTEHDDTCVHGALEETATRHGWDEATIAKARRYRAAVRAVTEHQPAAGARQDGAET